MRFLQVVPAGLALLSLGGAPAGTDLHLQLQWQRSLPGELQRARDVRWADGDSVFLAVEEAGTFRVHLGKWGASALDIPRKAW